MFQNPSPHNTETGAESSKPLPVLPVDQEGVFFADNSEPVLLGEVTEQGYEPGKTVSPHVQVNYRFLIVLSIASALSAGLLHLLHDWQMDHFTVVFLEQSERARQEGRPKDVATHLRSYLRLVPNDTKVLAQLARTLDEIAQTPQEHYELFQTLEKLLRKDPRLSESRRRLVDLAMRYHRFDDAKEHLNLLWKASPNNGEIAYLLGKCYEALGEYRQAVNAYESAIRDEPRQIDSYVRLSQIFRDHLSLPERADEVIDLMVASNHRSEAYLKRAQYRRKLGLWKPAIIDANRAYRLSPDETDVLVLLADLMLTGGRAAHVEFAVDQQTLQKQLEEVLREKPHEFDMRPYHALAKLALEANRLDLAEEQLRAGLQVHPDALDLVALLSEVLIVRGNLDEAREQIDVLWKSKGTQHLIDYLEARLCMQTGRWLEALKKLKALQLRVGRQWDLARNVAFCLAQCYRQMDHAQLRVETLQYLQKQDALSIHARLELASALVRVGRIDNALVQYAFLMQEPGVPREVARLSIIRNLRLPAEKRNWDNVALLIDSLAKKSKDSVEVLLLRADLLTAQKNMDRARELLQRACRQHPQQVRVWAALSEIYRRTGQVEDALQILKTTEEKLGRRLELDVSAVLCLVRQGGETARNSLKKIASHLSEYSQGQQTILLRALAGASQQLGEPGESERLWTELARRHPENLGFRFRLLNLAIQAQNNVRATQILEEIRRLEGEGGLYWKLGEATRLTMLAKTGDRQLFYDARTLLRELFKQRPTMTRIPVGLAEIAELQGQQKQAIDYYRQAIELGERDPSVLQRVVRLLYRQRNYYDAHELLERFQASANEPLSGEFGRIAVDILLRTSEFQRAVEGARQAVSQDSQDYRHQMWLAQVLWASEQREDAEQAFRNALSLAPQQLGPWVALVNFLARTERMSAAEAEIEKAKQVLGPQAGKLAFAQCYEAVGDREVAQQYYRSAMTAEPDNNDVLKSVANFYRRTGRSPEAETLYRKLIHPQRNAPPGVTASARRELAMLLAVRGNRADIKEAINLIDRNINENSFHPADLRTKARLLAGRWTQGNRRKAIQILEELDQRQPLVADDQFLLARMYLASGNWGAAENRFLDLLEVHGENPEFITAYLHAVLDRADVDDLAESWLKRLASLEPHSFRTMELQARMLIAQRKADDALKSLKDGLKTDETDFDADTAKLKNAAVLLTTLAQELDRVGRTVSAEKFFDEAERLYREYVKRRPKEILELAVFLGRRWQLDQALDLCERAREDFSPEMVASVCFVLMQIGQPNQPHFQRVLGWLEEDCRRNPDSMPLLFHHANVNHLAENYEKAEELYEKIIEVKPDAVAAYNELALLLALHRGKGERALELMNRAIVISGRQPVLLDSQAMVLIVLDRPKQAIRSLEEAVAESPTPAKYFHLAQAHLATGNRDAAKAALDQGIAAGLHAGLLHPLEQKTYQQVVANLKQF
jgi:tetratricopeptide (TPR) repeat protein